MVAPYFFSCFSWPYPSIRPWRCPIVISGSCWNPSTELGRQIAHGKDLWETNNCIGCHSLLGEGASFAQELGNVYVRFGNNTDAIKAFIQSRPADGVRPGHRSMPQIDKAPDELEGIAQFLKYASQIDTAGWPPQRAGLIGFPT